MSEKTKISWCDSTINWWTGCTKVSAGCQHCYAETLARRYGWAEWGDGQPRHKFTNAAKSLAMLNRKPWVCESCGKAFSNSGTPCVECGGRTHRRRIFHNSLSDWLDPEVPIEWLAEVLDGIRQASDCTHILCTKRPERWAFQMRQAQDAAAPPLRDWIENWGSGTAVPHNVILLTSVEDQAAADKRIPELLRIPAAVRGLSLEPLLGPVDLSYWIGSEKQGPVPGIDRLIVGGESGPKARPCNVEWIRSLVAQGNAAGVPVFVKQIGSHSLLSSGVRRPSKHPQGGDPDEWPADLRVQQFPT